jgi:hypothetical protein
MASEREERRADETRLFSAGDCPVCSDSGAVLLLKAVGTDQIIFYCPLCGVAWDEAPKSHYLDEIEPLETFAPAGVTLPTASEAKATGLVLVETDFSEWSSLLELAVKPR